MTNREGVVLAAKAFAGNPYDGHTLTGRSAIEATIGHMKTEGRLDPNFLLGQAGDAINALLAAAGHNPRLCAHRPGPLACLPPGRNRKGHRKYEYCAFSQPNRQ